MLAPRENREDEMPASRRSAAIVLAALLAGALSMPALAQDYPNRPIKVVVGFPPGGGTDTAARVIAQEMSKGLGQTMVMRTSRAQPARSAPLKWRAAHPTAPRCW
jgi:hypothetical protein